MFCFNSDTLNYLLANIKNKFSTIEEMNNKVDKYSNYVLSTNNLSNEEFSNINSSFNDAEVVNNLNGAIISFYVDSSDGNTNVIKELELDI